MSRSAAQPIRAWLMNSPPLSQSSPVSGNGSRASITGIASRTHRWAPLRSAMFSGPPGVHVGDGHGASELALQRGPAVQHQVDLDEPGHPLVLVAGFADGDRGTQQRTRLRARRQGQPHRVPGGFEQSVDRRPGHGQQLPLGVIVQPCGVELTVLDQFGQPQTHRRREVLPRGLAGERPHLDQQRQHVIPVRPRPRRPRHRQPRTYGYDMLKLLIEVWTLAGQPSGKYLAATMGLWLPKLIEHGELDTARLNDHTQAQLLAVSGATIDRLLKPTRDAMRLTLS